MTAIVTLRCERTGWSTEVREGNILPSCKYHEGGCLRVAEIRRVVDGDANRADVEQAAVEGKAP